MSVFWIAVADNADCGYRLTGSGYLATAPVQKSVSRAEGFSAANVRFWWIAVCPLLGELAR